MRILQVEVKLKKVDCIRWVALEGDATAPVPKAVPGGKTSLSEFQQFEMTIITRSNFMYIKSLRGRN